MRVFGELDRHALLKKTRFDVISVPGSTAMGIANEHSVTRARSTFCGVIERLDPGETLLFLLGEVDCGYLIWHRAERAGLPVEAQFERSLEAYTTFLTGLHQEGRPLIIAAVPPPVIHDAADWGESTHVRREIRAPRADRLRLTIAYNARLQLYARELGCQFLDYHDSLLDAEGQVLETFRNSGEPDWHMAKGPWAEVLAGQLRQLGYQ